MTGPAERSPRGSRVLLGISATADQAARLAAGGPRRDFVSLAQATGAEVHYQPRPSRRRGPFRRVIGPHLLQAWRMSGAARPGDVLFADSEHLGLPLVAFSRLRSPRPPRVVMIGHMPGRWWKRAAFRLLTRLGTSGTVLLHSVEQRRLLQPHLGKRWSVRMVPYQVDTEFWTTERGEAGHEGPMFLAVGSEHRDFETLARAAEGLPARVLVKAGSYWARSRAGLHRAPANVTYTDRDLSFVELRALYRQATAVVVPLRDVRNQSGVTTILEAMSLGLPVIATAARGQRECISGPLVLRDGSLDEQATADCGPDIFERPGAFPDRDRATSEEATGLYVPPGDADALRHAMQLLMDDSALAARLGAAAARSARRSFRLERMVGDIAQELRARPGEPVAAVSGAS